MRSRKVILALCLTALFMLACAGVAWASDTPTWVTTNRTGEHGGRIYQEFELKVGETAVDLSTNNVQWITVLEPGASKPKELIPNEDTTLWFNVEKPAGDYVFQVQTVHGAVYTATLNWPGVQTVASVRTGNEGPHDNGYYNGYYVEFKLGDLDLSKFDAMYQIKPNGQVFELDRNTDQTLWFKTAQLKAQDGRTIDPAWTQVEGTHKFLVFYKSDSGYGKWYKAKIEYPWEEKAATWQETRRTGPHDGKVYEEYKLVFDGQQIDLSDENLVSISVLEPSATTPEKLTPNTDQTLWFNVQNPKGDYKFEILTKNGTKYAATLAWPGTTDAIAAPTGKEAYNEGLGAYYVEYKFTSNGDQIDLSLFDAMYQIKPDSQVFKLQANNDENLWFKATDQVPGTHTFLVKKDNTWYEAEIDWHLFTISVEETVDQSLLGAYFGEQGQPKGDNKPTGLTRDKLAFLNSAEADLIAGNWYCAAVTCRKNVPGDVSGLQFAITTIPENAPFDIWMYDITGDKWYQHPSVWGPPGGFTAGPEYYNTGVTSLVFIYAKSPTEATSATLSVVLKENQTDVSNTLAATVTVQPADNTFTLELGTDPAIPAEYPWQELEGFDPETAEFITTSNPVLVAGNWYYAAITCKKNVPGDVEGLQFAITGLPADGDNTPFYIYMYDITGDKWYPNPSAWGPPESFKAGSEYNEGVTSYVFIKANQPTEEPTEVSVVLNQILNQSTTAVSNELTSTITVVSKAERAAVNLAKGWNTFSTPRLLQNATVGELFGEAYGTLITWDSEQGQWTILTSDDEIKPLQGYFVKVNKVLPVSLTFVTELPVEPLSKALHKGWNLVAPAYWHEDRQPYVPDFLATVDYNWAQLVSHPLNGDGWTYWTKNSSGETTPKVTPFSAYWLYMEQEDELASLG